MVLLIVVNSQKNMTTTVLPQKYMVNFHKGSVMANMDHLRHLSE